MHIESPILLIIALALLAVVIWRTRRLPPVAGTLLSTGAMLLGLAAAGVQVRCDRELEIVAMVDVSPSTRTATFRDDAAVRARLDQLLRGRRYTISYFSDGAVGAGTEVSAERSRLPATVADAVVLLSDGRFEAPTSLPPVFPVIDPALDRPADGRVEAIRPAQDVAAIEVNIDGSPRTLRVTGATAPAEKELAGGRTVVARDPQSLVQANLNPGDPWPENDGLSLPIAPAAASLPWLLNGLASGFAAIEPASLPTTLSAYLAPPAIVLRTGPELSAVQQQLLSQCVRELGGTLILVGSPRQIPQGLREISPMSDTPPQPQARWFVLLDASGSMAAPTGAGGSPSRWQTALDAAAAAVRTLDVREQVSSATFNRSLTTVQTDATPAAVVASLRGLVNQPPTGPTGLRAALQGVAAAAPGRPTRLLVVSDADADLGDLPSLIATLEKARVSVFLLATESVAPDAPAARLCQATGGRLLSRDNPAQWSAAMQDLVASARGDDVAGESVALRGTRELAEITFITPRRYRAYSQEKATATFLVGEEAVGATWQVGAGRVVTIAADVPDTALGEITRRLQQPPMDPRFAVHWDERNERVTVTAFDKGQPMNGLPLSLRQLDRPAVPLTQIAPGKYTASLVRTSAGALATIDQNGTPIAKHMLAGRYPKEFDRIGNDHEALQALANRTGGQLVPVGETGSLHLPVRKALRSIIQPLAMAGTLLLLAGVIFVRAPYLQDRLWRLVHVRKSAPAGIARKLR